MPPHFAVGQTILCRPRSSGAARIEGRVLRVSTPRSARHPTYAVLLCDGRNWQSPASELHPATIQAGSYAVTSSCEALCDRAVLGTSADTPSATTGPHLERGSVVEVGHPGWDGASRWDGCIVNGRVRAEVRDLPEGSPVSISDGGGGGGSASWWVPCATLVPCNRQPSRLDELLTASPEAGIHTPRGGASTSLPPSPGPPPSPPLLPSHSRSPSSSSPRRRGGRAGRGGATATTTAPTARQARAALQHLLIQSEEERELTFSPRINRGPAGGGGGGGSASPEGQLNVYDRLSRGAGKRLLERRHGTPLPFSTPCSPAGMAAGAGGSDFFFASAPQTPTQSPRGRRQETCLVTAVGGGGEEAQQHQQHSGGHSPRSRSSSPRSATSRGARSLSGGGGGGGTPPLSAVEKADLAECTFQPRVTRWSSRGALPNRDEVFQRLTRRKKKRVGAPDAVLGEAEEHRDESTSPAAPQRRTGPLSAWEMEVVSRLAAAPPSRVGSAEKERDRGGGPSFTPRINPHSEGLARAAVERLRGRAVPEGGGGGGGGGALQDVLLPFPLPPPEVGGDACWRPHTSEWGFAGVGAADFYSPEGRQSEGGGSLCLSASDVDRVEVQSRGAMGGAGGTPVHRQGGVGLQQQQQHRAVVDFREKRALYLFAQPFLV